MDRPRASPARRAPCSCSPAPTSIEPFRRPAGAPVSVWTRASFTWTTTLAALALRTSMVAHADRLWVTTSTPKVCMPETVRLFEQITRERGDAIAIVARDATLSFSALRSEARRLAEDLRAAGVRE